MKRTLVTLALMAAAGTAGAQTVTTPSVGGATVTPPSVGPGTVTTPPAARLRSAPRRSSRSSADRDHPSRQQRFGEPAGDRRRPRNHAGRQSAGRQHPGRTLAVGQRAGHGQRPGDTQCQRLRQRPGQDQGGRLHERPGSEPQSGRQLERQGERGSTMVDIGVDARGNVITK